MRSGDTLQPLDPKRAGPDLLKERAILYEADARDRAAERSARRRPPHLFLTSGEAKSCPLLAAHLEQSGGYPPPITRDAKARTRHLEALHSAYGPLAFLRLSLPALDGLGLYSPAMSKGGRKAVKAAVRGLLDPVAPYTANLQVGREGGVHAHLVTPLVCLLEPYRGEVEAALHGPGGGCDLPRFAGHGVVILETKRDRRKVARYVVRHPDARVNDLRGPAYLQGLEDELARKARRLPTVRLGWTVGVHPLVCTSPLKQPTPLCPLSLPQGLELGKAV